MNRSVRIFILGGVLAAARLSAQTTGDFVWRLEDVLAQAWETSPIYLAAKERVNEVEFGISEARSLAHPQISLDADWEHSRNPALLNSPDFEEFVDQFPDGIFEPGVQEIYSVGLEVQQVVYSWGKVGAGVKAARQALHTIRSGVDVARLEVGRQAARSYFDALAAVERRDVIARQEVSRGEALAVVESRYEIEEATELERLRARASLAQVAPQVALADGQARAARAALRAILGWDHALPELAVHTADLPSIPDDEAIVANAIAERPELRQLNADIELLRQRAIIVRAERKPQLDLTGRYGRQVADTDNFSDDLYDDWRVGLGFFWSLYDGGRRESEAARFDSQRRRRELDRIAAVLQIQAEAESTAAIYRAALEALESSEIAVQAATEATRVATEAYAEGVALQADLLAAQEVQQGAELAYVEATFTAWSAWADLCRAVGTVATDTNWMNSSADAPTELGSQGVNDEN